MVICTINHKKHLLYLDLLSFMHISCVCFGCCLPACVSARVSYYTLQTCGLNYRPAQPKGAENNNLQRGTTKTL